MGKEEGKEGMKKIREGENEGKRVTNHSYIMVLKIVKYIRIILAKGVFFKTSMDKTTNCY